MWEVKVGMYFLGGFGGTIGKYLRAKQSLDSTTFFCKVCDFQFLGQVLSLKKSIFFKHMKIAMKCALVMKYCFRLLKIDSKHLFLMKYHDSGDFRPSGSMLKNVIFRYFCQINNVHIVQYKIWFPLLLPEHLIIKKYEIWDF